MASNNYGNFSGEVLKRLIHWVRIGLISDPQGVSLVVNQIIFSLDRGEDSLKTLGISQEELTYLWKITNNPETENYPYRLRQYYHRPEAINAA